MKYLNNLITETKNKKVKEKLLLLQKFNETASENQQTFINAMMSMCGTNKGRYSSHIGCISVGRMLDDCFEVFLKSIVSEPIIVVSNYEDEPRLIVRDKHYTVSCFNLMDIQIKKVEVSKVNENLVKYLFNLHSQYLGLDYEIDMLLQEVE